MLKVFCDICGEECSLEHAKVSVDVRKYMPAQTEEKEGYNIWAIQAVGFVQVAEYGIHTCPRCTPKALAQRPKD